MSRVRPLTDRELRRRRKPGDVAVGGVAGLVLRVRTNARTFVLRYRTPEGTRRSYTLGQYPAEVTLAEARTKAGALRKQIRDGRDPVAERESDRQALRMVDLFGVDDDRPGWYLGEYVYTAGKLGTAKTPESIASDTYRIRKHLRRRKALMRKRVADVRVADLNRIKAKLTPGAWAKLRAILRIAFRHAEREGSIPQGSSPVTQTKAAPDRRMERYLSAEERKRLDDVLARATDGKHRPGHGWHAKTLSDGYARAIRLLLLTGMRRGEVINLRWEHIDWKHGQIALPTSKTGAKRIPLSPQALRFLRRERGDLGRLGPVCVSEAGGTIHPNNLTRAWMKVRKWADLPDVRIHDLRHSWASDAVSAGVPLHVVGAVLGHKVATTTHRYAHLHDKAIRDGLAKTGKAIERATKGRG